MSVSLSCSTPQCDDGHASLLLMRNTYDALSPRAGFDAARYRPQVEAIEAQYARDVSWYSGYIPFNETCCKAADIGKRADIVTNQMLQAAGEAPIDGPSSRFDSISLPVLIGLGLVAAIFIYAPRRG